MGVMLFFTILILIPIFSFAFNKVNKEKEEFNKKFEELSSKIELLTIMPSREYTSLGILRAKSSFPIAVDPASNILINNLMSNKIYKEALFDLLKQADALGADAIAGVQSGEQDLTNIAQSVLSGRISSSVFKSTTLMGTAIKYIDNKPKLTSEI